MRLVELKRNKFSNITNLESPIFFFFPYRYVALITSTSLISIKQYFSTMNKQP